MSSFVSAPSTVSASAPQRMLATPLPLVPGQVAVVAGAGRSGLAAVRLLHRLGVRVRLVDRRVEAISPEFAVWAGEAGVDILCGEHNAAQFAGAGLVVPSPGVAAAVIRPYLPAVNPPQIMAETELAFRCLSTEKVLAVTGTSGKTTTTSLCAGMLEAAGLRVFTGGNIGTPLSEYVLGVFDGAQRVDVVALELSSFQLQTCTTLHPQVAIWLNISANHLDYHADMEEYTAAKLQLFCNQTPADLAVLGPGLRGHGEKLAARVVYVERLRAFPDTRLMGPHNQFNAEAAYLACRAFGVSEDTASKAVAAFTPIEHRLELVDTLGGVLYVNDSKATTVDAMRVALGAFDGKVLLLAGGKFKGGDLAGLVPVLRARARAVGLYGAGRTYFEDAWQGAVPLSYDETLEAAMVRLRALAQPGDVVLLAPATASFDQYPNYEKRGEDFKRVVREVLA